MQNYAHVSVANYASKTIALHHRYSLNIEQYFCFIQAR